VSISWRWRLLLCVFVVIGGLGEADKIVFKTNIFVEEYRYMKFMENRLISGIDPDRVKWVAPPHLTRSWEDRATGILPESRLAEYNKCKSVFSTTYKRSTDRFW